MRRTPQTYALTINAFDKHRLFQRTVNAELLIHTILRYRDAGKFLVHGFVVMPDHLHLLLSPEESIEKAIQLVKGGYSFAIRNQHKGEVWQNGYFAHRVTDADDYAAQLGYIANNPTRKRLESYPFVHTTGVWRMDSAPDTFALDYSLMVNPTAHNQHRRTLCRLFACAFFPSPAYRSSRPSRTRKVYLTT